MKAAVLDENINLIVKDVNIPEISDNDVLVKVVACGVCHTDLHYIEHGVPTFKKPPLVLGHEASGLIEEVGKNVNNFQKEQRVLLPAVFSCGICESCRSGRENICQNMIMLGNSIDGAYAQYIKVPAKDVIHMPDDIPLEEGCIIADAVSTPYHAVINRVKVKPSETVIVFGCGGVGINVVQISAMVGAEVIACDLDDHKLKIAKELGAKYIINPKKYDIKGFLKENKLKINVAFEVIGNSEVIEQAYKVLGLAGRLCVIGYTNQNITINPAKIMFYEQEIIGSIGCPPVDYPKIVKLVQNGKININKLIAKKYALDDINQAFNDLRESKVLRNIVLPNGKNQDPLYKS